MPVWRLQCAWQADTAFARDAMIITPHFDDQLVGSDPQGLCDDMATALQTWTVPLTQITVKAYDAQGTPPVFPQGFAQVDAGTFTATGVNRDVALCLSFMAGQNRPRYRGRVYVPCGPAGVTPSGPRPSVTNQNKIGELAQIFQDLGGADVDWCVYSRVDDAARAVTAWWVDNAWDTQRRRGLPATSRVEGTTQEAG